MATTFVTSGNLKEFLAKVKAWANGAFVAKVSGKGLSTNDLTDELVAKINASGTSSFSGAYGDLTGKPSIEGHSVASGANTAASLGLATAAQGALADTAVQPAAISDMASKTYVGGLGYQTAANVKSTVEGYGYQTATQVNSAITGKGYQTAANVKSTVEGYGYQTSGQVTTAINNALTSAIRPKGSSALADLPTPAKANLGWMYNVTDAFTTTSSFTEGAGKAYPAGTNVVCVSDGSSYKWDVQGSFYDLTPYMKTADMVAMTDTQVDALFA